MTKQQRNLMDTIWEDGEVLDQWSTDENDEGETESNGGQEALVLYNGIKYLVELNWDDEPRRFSKYHSEVPFFGYW